MSLIIVTGCHRSGTSALARILQKAGVHIGEQLVDGGIGNNDGHFEDLEAVSIHNTILNDNGRTWQTENEFVPYVSHDMWNAMSDLLDRRSEKHQVWAFKDPRACLFLPLWRHLAKDMRVLAVFRDPADVISSLERRSYLDLRSGRKSPHLDSASFWTKTDLAARIWLTHNQALYRWAVHHQESTLLFGFDELQNPPSVMGQLQDRWSLDVDPDRTLEIWDESSTSPSGRPVVVHDDVVRRRIEILCKQLARLRSERDPVSLQVPAASRQPDVQTLTQAEKL